MKPSNNKKRIAVIMGARPNFVKAAPFFYQAYKQNSYEFIIVHTGQHFDENMSKIFFDEMNIPKPHINLNIGDGQHSEKIGKMYAALKKELAKYEIHAVIVFGDVNSTLAGAIAASKNQIKLIHIEAGLRSHDRRMPEEINRVIVDHLSDLLFTTEPSANINLLKEGVDKKKIKYVGNIMIESYEIFKNKINKSKILKNIDFENKKFILATIHRQENTDIYKILKKILVFLNKINNKYNIIFPLHPGTKIKIKNFGLEYLLKDLKIIDPVGYFDFVKLMQNSMGVITDSGGIQEETSHLNIPCCTLRDNTERPITIELGTNKLFPFDKLDINKVILHIENSGLAHTPIPLWDKNVSDRIFEHLKIFINK